MWCNQSKWILRQFWVICHATNRKTPKNTRTFSKFSQHKVVFYVRKYESFVKIDKNVNIYRSLTRNRLSTWDFCSLFDSYDEKIWVQKWGYVRMSWCHSDFDTVNWWMLNIQKSFPIQSEWIVIFSDFYWSISYKWLKC